VARRALLAIALVLLSIVALGFSLTRPAQVPPYTWGYVGCSNTHDTISGYHLVSSEHRFWPYDTYKIEGMTVNQWDDANSLAWQRYDVMVATYNGGVQPDHIWVQLCANLDPRSPNYHSVSYNDVVQMLANVRARAPLAALYVSPLQDYSPVAVCPTMGPGGVEIPEMQTWLAQAVAAGLALAGPGVDGIPNLGPLSRAANTLYTDNCHPTGFPHGTGPGTTFLGGQLASFFDTLP
jgi:hypothetical protein